MISDIKHELQKKEYETHYDVVHLENKILDDDNNVILTNFVTNLDKSILDLPKNYLNFYLKKIVKQYKNSNFIYLIIGESIFESEFKKNKVKNLISFFEINQIQDRLFFKSGNLSLSLPNYKINHIPILFWIGKTKCDIDVDNKQFDNHFLLQIRSLKPERERLYHWLKNENLLSKFKYSFASMHSNHPEYKSLEDVVIRGKNSNHQLVIKDYHNSTFCNIVCETWFINGQIFFTEKIDKPIVSKQPFIVFGSYGYLKKLKELGFKTFDRWWDESYDDIIDKDERFVKLQNLIIEISKWSLEKCNEVYKEMIPILNYNRKVRDFIKNNPQYSDGGYSNFDYIKNKISKNINNI